MLVITACPCNCLTRKLPEVSFLVWPCNTCNTDYVAALGDGFCGEVDFSVIFIFYLLILFLRMYVVLYYRIDSIIRKLFFCVFFNVK